MVAVSERRFMVAEYHRILEAGVFGLDENIELLQGRILSMPPQGPLHAAVVRRLLQALLALGYPLGQLLSEQPIALSADSEPVPDVFLVEPDPEGLDYEGGHPTPDRVLLVIEVAASTLAADLSIKARAYAAAGIPRYWVVDVENARLYEHTLPVAEGYANVVVRNRQESLALPNGARLEMGLLFRR
ncbi:Uma2 family endonuclease [Gloeobacter violaceus]|uniref:Gll2664 protein n=1 Tax=Gloeobacter violaceus (strain ATCC 29082 / PCC 7421) TaxID=251221 RepID=Q7NH73_GLOVI|nr:Uma2 family endonuclease [Gloeobacter violaceus]BAC90605.1 gll2664 [Gloeobacter violaceus PCC 7421]